jgi:hypothetical protein
MARYALVIGIAEYQPPLRSLQKTTADAEAVAQILERYGNFQDVKRLPARWNQARNCYEVEARGVTGIELGQALRTLLLEQAVKSEVLLYFTGHGFTISDYLGQSKGYLATSDCAFEAEGSQIIEQRRGVALDSLNHLIRASDLSSLVVLLDCCHGGYFLERNLVEQTLTAFSSKKDYYLITASRGFEQAYVGEQHSVFTEAILKGLSPENAGSDGQITGDRLFDYISGVLKGSGQEPIRMGWGRAVTLVTYFSNHLAAGSTSQQDGSARAVAHPPENRTLDAVSQPAQSVSNVFNISGNNTITNLDGSGTINYKEAPNQVRDIKLNFAASQSPSPLPLRDGRPMSIEVFFSYSHKDEELRDEMAKHLSILKREGVITEWYDRDIEVGDEWAKKIDEHLNSAQLILLLISSDFLASDYCYDIEMKRAMERHAAGEALVMPIILRPVVWQSAPFGKVQAYPKNAKPVTTWANRDEAFLDVAQSIRKAVKKMTTMQAQPSSAAVSATVIEQESIGLTTRQRRRLEQERDELQEQYDLLSEEIQHLRKSLRIDDLSPKERFRVAKQIEEAEAEREQISERIENWENKIE